MRKETIETSGRTKTSTTRKRTPTRSVKAKATPGKAAKPAAKRLSRPAASRQATGAAKTTTDHDTIRAWAEARQGTPVSVKGTARSKQHAGLLRIDFPGFSGEGKLEPVSWEEWFQKFEESKLAFLYQEKTKDGKQSRFFKLVKR